MRHWLLGLMLSGCYSPDLVTARFRCSSDVDCPGGQSCIVGHCAPLGADLAGSVELGGPDQASPPCSGAAVRLASDGSVYGCRGAFASGGAATLCGPGYRLCTADDAIVLRTLGAACDQEGGFFVSDITASMRTQDPMKNTVRCGTAEGSEVPILLGCGRPRDGMALGTSNCATMTLYLLCKGGGSFSCQSNLKTTAYNGADGGGALCCHR